MSIEFCQETLELLSSRDYVSGIDPLGGFFYNLDLTKPWIATAIHAGHNVRDELHPLMSITDSVRFYEEDPVTDEMIRQCPSSLQCLDSRTEYDLNRPREEAVPLTADMFWGTEVYNRELSREMVSKSIEKYDAFYRFMGSVVKVLLDRFDKCVVYDFHAYNIGRQIELGHANPPVFNVGTEKINRNKWFSEIEMWISSLSKISIPGCDITVSENEVFFGRGELCRRLSHWDDNILVLPTEVSKIYMNEDTGEKSDSVIDSLVEGITSAVNAHGSFFVNELN